MNDYLNNSFINGGIYKLKDIDKESIFLCSSNNSIGKIVRYKKVDNSLYEKTPTSYFLSFYIEGDLKQIFTKRENFDMVGIVGKNYFISVNDNQNYILEKVK